MGAYYPLGRSMRGLPLVFCALQLSGGKLSTQYLLPTHTNNRVPHVVNMPFHYRLRFSFEKSKPMFFHYKNPFAKDTKLLPTLHPQSSQCQDFRIIFTDILSPKGLHNKQTNLHFFSSFIIALSAKRVSNPLFPFHLSAAYLQRQQNRRP